MTLFLANLVEITLSMSAVILILTLILRLWGSKFTAQCRYILWTVVLLRLAVPVGALFLPALIEIPVPAISTEIDRAEEEAERDFPDVSADVQTQPQFPYPGNTSLGQAVPSDTVVPPASPQVTTAPAVIPETVPPQMPAETLPADSGAEAPASAETHPPLSAEQIFRLIGGIYAAVAAVFLAWHLLTYIRFTSSVRRSGRAADGVMQKLFEQICRAKGIRRMPRLIVSPRVSSPCAFGWFSTCIAMPETALSGEVLAGTLLHEITHCRRGDLFIKGITVPVRALHWFNPLVHYAAEKCATEMELSCDETVLRGCSDTVRSDYGGVMLEIVRRCSTSHGSMTTHFNPRRRAVKLRFLNIINGSGSRRGVPLIALCLVICLLAGTIIACRVENPAEKGGDTEEEILLPETAAETAIALTEQIVDYVMTKDWLTDGYTFTKVDADRLVYSLTAMRGNAAHPCASSITVSDDGRYMSLPMKEAEELTRRVFGYEDWAYYPATEYEVVQRDEAAQTYRFALETGLWNSSFRLMEISTETEENRVLVRGILKNSDRYEYSGTMTYGIYTFVWEWTEDGFSLADMYLRDTSMYEIDLIWHDGREMITPAEYFDVSVDRITGLTTEKFPTSAPITVGGNTVFIAKTADGYAAGWVEGEYAAADIPFARAHWFRVAADPPAGEGIPVMGAFLDTCPGVLRERAFVFGFQYTTIGTSVYYFDDSGVLQFTGAPGGMDPLETDIDGDGEKELITMQDGDGYIWDEYAGGIRYVDGNELNRQLTDALGGSAMWNPYVGGIRVSVYKQYVGTSEYSVEIRGDQLKLLPLSKEEWKKYISGGENGAVQLSVPADTEQKSGSFRITVGGQTAEIHLGGAAALAGPDAPLIRCADYTGDGIDDALVIFRITDGIGLITDAAILVSGADGSAFSPQNEFTALNDRLEEKDGTFVLKTDDGESVPLSGEYLDGDSVRLKKFSLTFVENGVLQGKAVLGYGAVNAADPTFFLEYGIDS
ncbi:MAG: hypothetical protein E7662_12220, partial [Ruminococcaceae bacterium]|nr:hypothetical protein [Oscillospiraceae bacterium]